MLRGHGTCGIGFVVEFRIRLVVEFRFRLVVEFRFRLVVEFRIRLLVEFTLRLNQWQRLMWSRLLLWGGYGQ